MAKSFQTSVKHINQRKKKLEEPQNKTKDIHTKIHHNLTSEN